MRLQAGAAGDAGQDEAAALAVVGLGQLVERLVDPLDRLFHQLGQQPGGSGSTATNKMASIVRPSSASFHRAHHLTLRSRRSRTRRARPARGRCSPGQLVGRHARSMRSSPKVAPLPEGDPAHLAQLEQGQEAHDDVDAGPAAGHQRRGRWSARSRLGHGDQLGHRLGHRDGVHRDVGEVDPRHRALGRPAQVGLGEVLPA